jgi:hypothetical protein
MHATFPLTLLPPTMNLYYTRKLKTFSLTPTSGNLQPTTMNLAREREAEETTAHTTQ